MCPNAGLNPWAVTDSSLRSASVFDGAPEINSQIKSKSKSGSLRIVVGVGCDAVQHVKRRSETNVFRTLYQRFNPRAGGALFVAEAVVVGQVAEAQAGQELYLDHAALVGPELAEH